MFNKVLTVILILSCMLLPACSGRSRSESSDSSVYIASSEAQLPESNLLNTILFAELTDVQGFSYNGNAAYYFGGEHGLWSKGGYSAIEFSCPNNYRKEKRYLNQEYAIVRQFAESLSRFPIVDDFVKDMTENTVLPESDYISFGLTLCDYKNPDITIFETGDIYLTQNSSSPPSARHYKAADKKAYSKLKNEIVNIRATLDALPLDYQIEMGVFTNLFKPESTALRLTFENIGKIQILYSREFIVEKKENGIWHQLSEKEPTMATAEMQAIEPRSTGNYTVDLTNLEGGQEPGQYRVSNKFYAGEEEVTLTTTYEIRADAIEISLPYKPQMTPENQSYYDKYLSAWGFYRPFEINYDEETFAQDFQPYLLYYSSAAQEGRRDENDKFGVDIPAQIVEKTIIRHFLVTIEQYRASLPKSRNSMEYYDSEKGIYHFEGGYGGVGFDGVVTEAKKEGNLLMLSCDWYDVTDCFQYSHTVTIQLGQQPDEFYYIKNIVTEKTKAE
ncbi:immunoglobulin-like domain-containing protein [Oscillospiraceae bacterium LTW-04]|nr:hypothetical protein RBH76_08950 [Oscillospiraceae bacterium MB24-C1]